jgi:hypothetical protein
MKPLGAEREAGTFELAKKDLAVFRYEVLAKNPDASIDIEIKPVSDTQAAIYTPRIDGAIESIQIRVDEQGRQIAKQYRYLSGAQDQRREVSVSPDGVRSKLTALELFPLDWPSVHHRTVAAGDAPSHEGLSRSQRAQTGLMIPAALQELLFRSEFVERGNTISFSRWARTNQAGQVVQGTDFFGRPIDLIWDANSAWPIWMRTPHGVAVLLKVLPRAS